MHPRHAGFGCWSGGRTTQERELEKDLGVAKAAAEEERQTEALSISRQHAQVRQYEEQLAALGSQMERCIKERNRVLATLGRVEDVQVEGMELCGITCSMIMLCTSKKR